MDIAADETYRVFLGDEASVSTVIATDWDDCDCRWNSAESYTFDVHRGGYIYVVASNHYGPSMLLVRLSYADGTIIYSGVNHPLANWEVSNIFREVLTMYPPPEPEDVNRWIASTTSWESPSIGGEAGLNVSGFAYLRPARYIWKFPGGSRVWGFSGYTGPGTALFRIRVIWRTQGDVNGDGCVDDSDLLQVLFAFGNTGSNLPEDLNRDGVVDDADLLIVLFNFGSGC
jgi:hypothetical protein